MDIATGRCGCHMNRPCGIHGKQRLCGSAGLKCQRRDRRQGRGTRAGVNHNSRLVNLRLQLRQDHRVSPVTERIARQIDNAQPRRALTLQPNGAETDDSLPAALDLHFQLPCRVWGHDVVGGQRLPGDASEPRG